MAAPREAQPRVAGHGGAACRSAAPRRGKAPKFWKNQNSSRKVAKAQRLAKRKCFLFFATFACFAPLRETDLAVVGLIHTFCRHGPHSTALRLKGYDGCRGLRSTPMRRGRGALLDRPFGAQSKRGP
jgi:hypothetical protein